VGEHQGKKQMCYSMPRVELILSMNTLLLTCCLTGSYYEWLTKVKDKLPHFTKRKDGKLLLMAGLYDSVVLEGKTLWTFTIVTTDANKDFSWLHERQPVFLSNRDALYRWLDTSTQSWTPELTKMVQPYSDTSVPLECYAVPKEVGKVGTESSTFIEPVTTRKDGIQAMFSKQRQKSPEKPTTSPTKRKHETSPSPVKSSTGQQDSPRSKRLKADLGDDSNQPNSARDEIQEGSSQNSKSKVKSSPVKKKTAKKDTSLGNGKISSFFGKS